jgi:hypothetical protein
MSDLAHRPWNAWRIARWSVAATLLAIPAVMMQVPGSGFDWSVGDFVFAGAMIVGTALLYEWLATRSEDAFFRAGTVAALAAAFLLVWINLAVGVIANEDDPTTPCTSAKSCSPPRPPSLPRSAPPAWLARCSPPPAFSCWSPPLRPRTDGARTSLPGQPGSSR